MPWVLGLPLSAPLHYKERRLRGEGAHRRTDRQERSVDSLLNGQMKVGPHIMRAGEPVQKGRCAVIAAGVLH